MVEVVCVWTDKLIGELLVLSSWYHDERVGPDRVSEDPCLVCWQTFVVDEYLFDFVEQVVGHAEFEQSIVDARQDEVGETCRIESVGIDEYKRDVSIRGWLQYSRPPSSNAVMALSVLLRRRDRSLTSASMLATLIVR